ncbi:MAG: hypothetical protein IAX21_02715 [Candidatus Bathyarchaeota archaeon]|nr:MAG: hypothetical protein IAX21_02715 [Candidatus Bathyarchaeota archaeon]
MKMQINKKIYSSLLVTLLALSAIAIAIPAAFAVPITDITVKNSITGATITSATVGTMVNIEGVGATPYGLVQIFWDSLGTKLGEAYATGTGSFVLRNVLIPEDVAGEHTIIAQDQLSSTIYAEAFTINPKVTVSSNKALPGDSLTVAGTGFGDETDVRLYLGTLTPLTSQALNMTTMMLENSPVAITTVAMDVDVLINGTLGGTENFTNTAATVLNVVDNGKGVLSGTLDGVAVLTASYDGTVNVTVTGTINYATGAVTLTATGIDGDIAGDDAVTNIVVLVDAADVDYTYAQYDVTPAAGVETSELGSFSTTIMIPAITVANYGNYLFTAIDSDGNQVSPAPVNYISVNYYIIANPTSGPAGITVNLSGRIPASTAYEIRIGTTTIATGTSGADTTFTQTHVISSFLAIGVHQFSVVWGVTNERTADFEVTNPPQIALSSTSGMAGQVITISSVTGYPFIRGADLTLLINGVVVNSTELDDRFGPTSAVNGYFTDLQFTVPSIAPGTYTLELRDSYGATTGNQYTFTVTATPTTSVSLSGTSYYVGDTISFVISTTDASTTNVDVTIRSPTGAVWWTADNWVLTGTAVRTVIFQDQLYGTGVRATLPDDAPLGSWNWTVTYSNSAKAVNKATGLFTVAAKATLDTVTADIADLVDEISDISGDIATIRTNVNNVRNLIEALDIDIPDMTALTNDIASLKVSVNSLDAVVTAIAGDVATVDTKIGTLTGTITSIDGDIATIQTDVGTLQADLSDVKANVDNTPAWIAVVLALVAAVAAIFAVITIRQKIAG